MCALLLVVSCGQLIAGSASHQYFRFTPTKLRDNAAANSVQLAEVQVFSGATQLSGATASNPGGNNPGGEAPPNAVDGSITTKWLDFNKGALVPNFGGLVTIDSYRWATANDATDRDPIRWTLEGSNDNLTWKLLDDRTGSDFAVPTARQVFVATLDLNQEPDTPGITFTITHGGVTSDSAVGVQGGGQVTLA